MVDSKPLVIFVPGLYSSTLHSTSSSRGLTGCFRDKWNPPKSVLFPSLVKGNNGHPNLALPITWTKNKDGIYVQDQDEFEVHGCLVSVQDKLLKFLETLHTNGLIELHKVLWDWRRSFEEADRKSVV